MRGFGTVRVTEEYGTLWLAAIDGPIPEEEARIYWNLKEYPTPVLDAALRRADYLYVGSWGEHHDSEEPQSGHCPAVRIFKWLFFKGTIDRYQALPSGGPGEPGRGPHALLRAWAVTGPEALVSPGMAVRQGGTYAQSGLITGCNGLRPSPGRPWSGSWSTATGVGSRPAGQGLPGLRSDRETGEKQAFLRLLRAGPPQRRAWNPPGSTVRGTGCRSRGAGER